MKNEMGKGCSTQDVDLVSRKGNDRQEEVDIILKWIRRDKVTWIGLNWFRKGASAGL
jgi:hypothetical protein